MNKTFVSVLSACTAVFLAFGSSSLFSESRIDSRIVGIWRHACLDSAGSERFPGGDIGTVHPAPKLSILPAIFTFGSDGSFVADSYFESYKTPKPGGFGKLEITRKFDIKDSIRGTYRLFDSILDASLYCNMPQDSIHSTGSFDRILLIILERNRGRELFAISFSGQGKMKTEALRGAPRAVGFLLPLEGSLSGSAYMRRLVAPAPWWQLEGEPPEEESSSKVQRH